MIKDILADVSNPDQVRVAVLEDNELAEFFIEKRESKSIVGNIYRAKVERLLPGMQSAFVDIGLKKNAILYVNDLIENLNNNTEEISQNTGRHYVISNLISQGQEITVQVIKDPSDNKGACVSTSISISGHYSVLTSKSNVFGISRKIEDAQERNRLLKLLSDYKGEEYGLILRTACETVPDKYIIDEINQLALYWNDIRKKEQKGSVPRLLYKEPDIITRTVREYLKEDINQFLINGRDEYENIYLLIKNQSPSLTAKIKYYSKEYEMFEYYHVKSAIREALSKKVWLKSGAYLVFDYTEALSVIDVNSGKYVGKTSLEDTAFKINLEAAAVIARQIRLRNLSGIIIVDFIDMKIKEHKDTLLNFLRDEVKNDRINTVVVGMTSLGLVEITRKKVRQPLHKILEAEGWNQ